MNEFQKIWLESYKNWIRASSFVGEVSPSDYTQAREHADAVLNSLIKAGEVSSDA
ncbi:MAG: hypothetical protein ACOH2G_05060 [Ewingella sp.]